mgnify:CR=1 FL=1
MIEILAIAIPLEIFDQQKLEALVRKIPTALIKTETVDPNKQKKIYSFPKMDDKGFKINCDAEHFLGSALPSKSSCTLHMLKEADARMDEHQIEFKDPFVVNALYDSISYGTDTKKWFTSERVYGVSLNGRYKEHFRYAISCSKEKCQMTFSTKPAENNFQNQKTLMVND